MGEIFAKHISGKKLISKIYKELIQLYGKKNPRQSNLQMARGTELFFSKKIYKWKTGT